MGLRTLNGLERVSVAVHPGEQRPRNGAHEVSNICPDTVRRRSAKALDDPAALPHGLDASERQLDAALRQIEKLLKQESLLKKKVLLLKQAAVQARQFAYHDELTGLANRRLLLDRFNQAVARGNRQHTQVALLFLDLDGFKKVNDRHGHAAGDKLLQQVAARLIACIRTSDTACRYGGDEFVILLPELEGQDSAIAASGKICAHLATPYYVNGATIQVTTSIGMAVYPVDGTEYGDLISQSDAAMFCDKARGPTTPSFPSTRRRPDVQTAAPI